MRIGDTHLLAAVDEFCITDALVVTLKHDSHYCVAAAAATLQDIGQTPGRGPALIEASSAIPALVGVIGAARPPVLLDTKTGFLQRCVVVDAF